MALRRALQRWADVVNSHSSTDSWLLACLRTLPAPRLVRTRGISRRSFRAHAWQPLAVLQGDGARSFTTGERLREQVMRRRVWTRRG